jgi:uncharacterized membrane protein YccF (DUF307 family)
MDKPPNYEPPITPNTSAGVPDETAKQVEIITIEETYGCGLLFCNVIWVILFGFESFVLWMFAGAILCITIVGIPFGIKCFKLAFFILFPFGQTIKIHPREAAKCPMMLGNILWLIFLGLPIAIYHLAMAFVCFITIIGIPFAYQHFRFAMIALWPFGVETGFNLEPENGQENEMMERDVVRF